MSLSKASIEASNKYVESFIPDTMAVQQARRASADLGIEPVSPAVAHLLTMFARLINAKAVVEIGTGAGVSSLAFFAGMDDDATLTTVDSEAEHQIAARQALKAAGISHSRYRLIVGEALTVVPKLRGGAYDIVFVDADFLEYPEYLEEGLRCVRPGGMLILNHALLDGKVADETNFDDDTMLMRDTLEAARNMDTLTTSLLPVGDGLFICVTSADA
ncbi:MAG: O-methyltransferase [Propionibacteriaceae bacterium]|nr:O-methyltransferase [Propionibacteriaceae bacterium]